MESRASAGVGDTWDGKWREKKRDESFGIDTGIFCLPYTACLVPHPQRDGYEMSALPRSGVLRTHQKPGGVKAWGIITLFCFLLLVNEATVVDLAIRGDLHIASLLDCIQQAASSPSSPQGGAWKGCAMDSKL